MDTPTHRLPTRKAAHEQNQSYLFVPDEPEKKSQFARPSLAAKVALRHLPEELKHLPGVGIWSCSSRLFWRLRHDRKAQGKPKAKDSQSHAAIYLMQLRHDNLETFHPKNGTRHLKGDAVIIRHDHHTQS